MVMTSAIISFSVPPNENIAIYIGSLIFRNSGSLTIHKAIDVQGSQSWAICSFRYKPIA